MLAPGSVSSTYLLFWIEHCIECAIPDCYALCPLYVRRADRKCARFKNGVVANPKYPGLHSFGAEVEFRRWGKLESTFGFGAVTPERARLLDGIDRSVLKSLRSASSVVGGLKSYARMNPAYTLFRERLLQAITQGKKRDFDEFVVEAWNLDPEPVRLVIECWQGGLAFRTSILLDPGRTIRRIPASSMNIDLYGAFGMIRVYPDNDAEAHLVFSWLDFVRYTHSAGDVAPHPRPAVPTAGCADKVKCVIWDLDDTAWNGILGEQDSSHIRLRPEVLQTMLALDEKGILQSIASKNDHNSAWQVLKRAGVAHLFLCPQINWEPKSTNIQRIVTSLNIGTDSCAFIDDSPFERAEVANALPGLRTFADSDVHKLLELPEFEVPITEESRQRRAFYAIESERRQQAGEYGDRYETFLKTCRMEATLFRPTQAQHVERCLELLHRSNQFNLSTHRYRREEFQALLDDQTVISISTSCRDCFGDYGIVGFASLTRSGNRAVLKDFVLSCRVAQKKLENAWFRWLASAVAALGCTTIEAPYTRTSRNGVLLDALLEVGFVESCTQNAGSMLELRCNVTPPASHIVSIVADSLELRVPLMFSLESRDPASNHLNERQQAAS